MEGTCGENGLVQIVKEPTRGVYLLDLCATDLDSSVKAKVLHAVADHKGVLVTASFSVPAAINQSKMIWHYKSADWQGLKAAIAGTEWSWMDGMDLSRCADALTEYLLQLVHTYIPHEEKLISKTSHPWLNETCLQLIAAKHAAAGTAQAEDKAKACSAGLLGEYLAFIQRTRTELK